MEQRTATYTRVPFRRDRAEVARRQRRLAETVSRWTGAVLVAQEADAGPTSSLGRPGLTRLLEAARAGALDSLVVEHLGRLGPTPEESRRVVEAFAASGVRVVALGKDHRKLISAGTAAAIVKLIGG